MSASRLESHAYGKVGIRLAKVERSGDWHTFHDLTIQIRMRGDFAGAYTDGDNSTTIPTDTMRATAYALAADESLAETERYLERLGRRLLSVTPAANTVTARALVHAWERLRVHGAQHPHSFRESGPDATAEVQVDRDGPAAVTSGLAGLTLAKTTGSGFSGFLTDDLTVLAETDDRILATAIEAEWTWLRPPKSYVDVRGSTQRAIEEVFATQFSPAVQRTLYAAGEAVLSAVPEIAGVTLRMPNRHHVAVDLTPFGRANSNEVFTVPDRPYGLIEGTVTRG